MRFTYKIVNSGQGTNSVSFQGFGLKINAGFPGIKKTTDGSKSAFLIRLYADKGFRFQVL